MFKAEKKMSLPYVPQIAVNGKNHFSILFSLSLGLDENKL
jgi:hypothetical protein